MRGKLTQRNIFVAVLLLAFIGSVIPMTEYIILPSTAPAPEFIWNGIPFRPVGLNYYPSSHPWTGTWERFNATELDIDCDLAKELGANCFRTFIQWYLIETAPGVYNMTIANRIVEFFDICSDHDIAIQFSFFDFGPPSWAHAINGEEMFINETLIDLQIAQLQFLIPLINEKKAGFICDLRNEPMINIIPLSSFVYWVANLSSAIRAMGDTHYIVVGGAYGNFDTPKAFAPYVDAVCMHFYGARNEPHWKREFERYLVRFQEADKPIILQEFGWPSYDWITEKIQADHYRAILSMCDKYSLAGVMAWCMWEYPTALWNPAEQSFGLLRPNGEWKPAAYVFHEYATGTMVPYFNYMHGEGYY